MNIFASYPCPVASARVLDDRRVIKLTTESVQMLCTALRFWGARKGKDGTQLYRDSQPNHPCNVWVRESGANFVWLHAHAQELSHQYSWRFHKGTHAAWARALDWDLLGLMRKYSPKGFAGLPLTPFANCASNLALGVSFRHEKDVHLAYRKYLARRWALDTQPPKCSILTLVDTI